MPSIAEVRRDILWPRWVARIVGRDEAEDDAGVAACPVLPSRLRSGCSWCAVLETFVSKYQGNVPALRALIDDCTLHAGGTEGATSGAATDQLAAPAPGKKRKHVDFNPAAKVRLLVEVVLG